jgi:hypothetical protein
MATIFSYSDTAPLICVIICCTTVTTRNILSRGWLFVFWARTDWTVWWGCTGAETLWFLVGGRSGVETWGACGCCCCLTPRSAAAKEMPGVVWLEENTLPVAALGVHWDFFFCSSSFASLQPRYLAGCGFSSSASWQLKQAGGGGSFVLFRALFV